MNYLDIVVIAIVLISGLLALARGMVRELLSVAGWIAAAFATLYGFGYTRPLAREWIPITWAADAAAGLSIFLVTLVLVTLLSSMIAKRVQNSRFSALDRSLGFLFGILRGGVLLSLAYLLMNWALTAEEQPKWVRTARSLPVLAYGADLLTKLAPDDLMEGSAAAVDRANRETRKAIEAERTLRTLTLPPVAGRDARDRGGYTSSERRAMERAVESSD